MKTHFKKLRNPNYIGSWDLLNDKDEFQPIVVTITGTKKEMVHDGKGGQSECFVVTFKETKPMVVNSTNAKAISKAANSPFVEDWVGKRITLSVQKVKAFGEQHDAIRVQSQAPAKPKLTPDSKVWAAAQQRIAAGTTTIAKIRESYELSAEHEQLLSTPVADTTTTTAQ